MALKYKFKTREEIPAELKKKAEAFHAKPITLPESLEARGVKIFEYEINAGAFTLDEIRTNKSGAFGPLPNGAGATTAPSTRSQVKPSDDSLAATPAV